MDWKLIIADLKAAGWNETKIATEVGCGQASVSEIGSGKTMNPRYNLGRALVVLHARVCPKARRPHSLASRAGRFTN